MLEPLICHTCRRGITHGMWKKFEKAKEERTPQTEQNKKAGVISYTHGEVSFADIFDEMGVRRICCRSMYTTTPILVDKIS